MRFELAKQLIEVTLIDMEIESDECSPNLVAQVASELEISLSSTEVVFISDNYNNERK